ncbi:hypothetical protein BDZ89DRAFT_1129100 [Hymenopellis radicata]|nr:hypothetical protein BDZ89DRAFT_1129100 [Hymenopellis radicata]
MAGLALPIHLGSELAIRTSSYSPLSDAIDILVAHFRSPRLQRPVKSASTNTKTPADSQAGLEEEQERLELVVTWRDPQRDSAVREAKVGAR